MRAQNGDPGKYDAAIDDLRKATTLDAPTADMFYWLGEACRMSSDSNGTTSHTLLVDALNAYTSAINIRPQDGALYDRRAGVHEKLREYSQAIADYTLAIKYDPRNASYFIHRGNAYLEQSQDTTIGSQPEQKKVAVQGENPASRPTAPNSSQKQPSIEPEQKEALEKQRQNLRNLARQDYDQAKIYNQEHAAGVIDFNEGLLSAIDGKFQDAIDEFAKAIKEGMNNWQVYYQRGLAYLDALNYEDAIADFSKAITFDQNDYRPYYRRSVANFYAQHFQQVVDDANQALAKQPNQELMYFYRGRANLFLGNPGAAADDFTAAIGAAPDYAFYAVWLHIARMNEGLDDRDEFIQNGQKYEESWQSIVYALFLGKTEPEDVMRAAANAKGDTQQDQICQANYYIGLYQVSKGNLDDATKLFQTVQKTCPHGNIEFNMAALELASINLGARQTNQN
jgi:tetratricopeptide (TPR) repeat protein